MESTSFDVNDKNSSNQNFEELFSETNGKNANELDNFFEDLTSLDDTDPAPPDVSPPAGDKLISGVTGDLNSPKNSQKPPSRIPKAPMSQYKKKRLKKWLYTILIILLVLILLSLLYSNKDRFLNLIMPDSSLSNLIPPSFQEEFSPNTQIQTKPPENTFLFDATNEDTKAGIDPDGKYAIQVAVCMFQSCIDEFTNKLQQVDYTTQAIDYNVRGEYIEMISEGSFTYNEAAVYASEINQINNIMGNATIIPLKNNQYKISLGNFFALEDFKQVRQLIESNISDSRISMIENPRRQRAKTFRVIVGPYATKEKAESVQEDIRQLAGLKSAFIVDYDKL